MIPIRPSSYVNRARAEVTMRWVALVLLLAMPAIVVPSDQPIVREDDSAKAMLGFCRKLLAGMDENGDVIRFTQNYETGTCIGAFSTIQHLSTFVIRDDKTPALRICAPPDSRMTDFIWVFVEYGRRNPKKINGGFAQVAMQALWEAYPCK